MPSDAESTTFRVQSRYVLLTYAQCAGLDPHEVVLHFSRLGAECIIGREYHADGGVHLHCFVDFGRKFRSKRVGVFDVQGCHPNISSSRGNPAGGYDYAIKDGDVVGGGLARPVDNTSSSNSDIWSTLVGLDNEQVFWDTCRELAPRVLLVSFPSLRKYADWRFAKCPIEYSTPPGISIDTGVLPELDNWVFGNLTGGVVGTF